jgi:Family of unknown function (DUF6416)/HNH endonuclease
MKSDFVILDDDDEFWKANERREGHSREAEWAEGDESRAQDVYSSTTERCRLFLNLLIDHPATQVPAEWIADQIGISEPGKSPRRSVSGLLQGMHIPCDTVSRRYPWTWRDGTYAIKRKTAMLFRFARYLYVDSPRAGYTVGSAKFRIGQQSFRKNLIGRFGQNCAFTGPQPLLSLEAAHIRQYSISQSHDAAGGLLIRRDLHALFDAGYITIDAELWQIDVHPGLDAYAEIAALKGRPPTIPLHLRPAKAYLDEHAAWTRAAWPQRSDKH